MAEIDRALEVKNKVGRNIFRSYLIGFICCAILSTLAFDFVQHHVLSTGGLYGAITLMAIAQLFIQVIFFLRITTNTEDGKWNLMTLIFTVLIIAILVCGSLWIMYNLNYNMVH